jgi:ComEC/Rec2-related protein
MKLLFFIAAFLGAFHYFDLPNKLSTFSLKTQMICQEMLPSMSEERATIGSLICGEKVTDEQNRTLLQSTGLIHIFVVSGAHLLVISEILRFFRVGIFLRAMALLGFALITGLQAPCLRSLISLGVWFFLSRNKFFLTRDQKVLIAGLFTLALFPQWSQSLSLQISWMAALALSFSSAFQDRDQSGVQKALSASFWVYLFLLPLISCLGGLHPMSILWNVTIGSFIAFIFFPLCFFALLNFYFLKLLEILMKPFWVILGAGQEFNFPSQRAPPSYLWGWLWIFALHFLVHFGSVFYKKNYRT